MTVSIAGLVYDQERALCDTDRVFSRGPEFVGQLLDREYYPDIRKRLRERLNVWKRRKDHSEDGY
jgi:hypothetical protein